MHSFTNPRLRYRFVYLALVMVTALGCVTAAQERRVSKSAPRVRYSDVPLYFEKNVGQTSNQVKFLSRGAGYELFLTSTGAVLELQSRSGPPSDLKSSARTIKQKDGTARTSVNLKNSVVRITFIGSREGTSVNGADELEAKNNYFVGNDPKKWLTAIPTFAQVRYSEVYPGVDVVYYGNQEQLEYDLVLQPHADLDKVRIGVEGIKRVSITRSGDAMLDTEVGSLVFKRPTMYQDEKGRRRRIKGSYVTRGEREIGIRAVDYDKRKALIVDPVLVYSTYLGGSGTDASSVHGSAVDAQGSVYICGQTTSSDFPETKTFGPATTDGSQVAFVSKLNATGTGLIYSTFLSGGNGTSEDSASAAAVDANGYVYVTGSTTSGSFPITGTAYQPSPVQGSQWSIFVSKLSADGQSLVYSTYLGGPGSQWSAAIAVDANQVAYVGGALSTNSTFPVTASAFQGTNRSADGNGFVSKIDTKLSGASSLAYSTLLGGSSNLGEGLYGVAVDSSGKVAAVGWTFSTDFPVTSSAFQGTSKAQTKTATSFLSQIDTTKSGASSLVYSTYFGGSAVANPTQAFGDYGTGVALDSTGKVYVTGTTRSADFPVTLGAEPAAVNVAFVAKFDLTKSGAASLVYSRVISGGNVGTSGGAITVDSVGDVYLAGGTSDSNYPVTADAIQSTNKSPGSSGGGNGFLTVLSSDASTILYSTYFGSSAGTTAGALSLDPENNIYLSGFTAGIDLPTTEQLFQPTLKGTFNVFVAKFGGISTPTIANLSASSGTAGTAITITGLNFGSSQGTVTFNGVAGVPTIWGPGSILVPVPVGAKSGNIVVTAGGVPSNGMPFTVLSGPMPVVLVQHATKSAGTTTSAVLSFASNNSAGNWIGVCVRASGTNQSLSVADSNGNFYRQALSVNETGGGNTLAMFYAENIVAGPNIVTVSDPASSNLQIAILEYSGVTTYSSLDSTVSAAGNGTSPSSGNISTTANGDLLLSAVITASGASLTAGSGYTEEDVVPFPPNTDLMMEDGSLSQAGTASATATLSASGTWAIGLAAFKRGANNVGTSPTIISLNPPTGSNGTTVTINGYNFGAIRGTVTFNGTTASPTAWTDSATTVKDPTGATDGFVVVTVGGVASNGVWFPQPHITSTSPGQAAVGATVTINGSHFGGTTGTVRFNGIGSTPSSWTTTQVIVPVPAGATTGPIVLTNSNGIVSNNQGFTVTGQVPKVTSLSPTTGAVGTLVTVSGSGFGSPQGSSVVTFNGVPAGTASTWASGTIKIAVPTGATTGNVIVTASGQSDLQTNIFTVPGTPSLSGMSPVRGGVGSAITITGSNLGSSGTIKINGITATPWSWSSTLIVVPVPSGATSGSVIVTAGGVQMSAGVFDVRSSIPSTATEFSYDAMGRVTQKTLCTPMNCGTGQAPSNLSVTYDLAGETTSTSFNGPIISYAYDTAGRVTQVTSNLSDSQHPGTLATVDASNGYWPTGPLRKLTFGNNLTESDVYNSRGQPCRINVNSSGTLLSNCSDALPTGNFQDFNDNFNTGTSDNGNVIGFKGTGQQNFNRSYVYDSLNRIQSMSAPGDQCSGLSWTIDPWGNRTAQNNQGGSCLSPSVSVDTNNKLSGGPYQYDLSGDLTNDGSHTYTYDAEGRITNVDAGSSATYIYDAFGARVEKVASGSDLQYVYDQNGQMNTVFSNGASQRAFVYLRGSPIAEYFENTTYFVHLDHLGSTRLLTKVDQTVRESDDYYPFGELIPSVPATGDINKFTGKEHDSESGLDNFGKRYHASSLGRFMTPDPIGIMKQKLLDPQQWNLYGYARNSPLRLTDPTGMYNTDCKTNFEKCSKEIQNFEATRKKNLQSKDPVVRRTAAAYGEFNDGNKVNVRFDPSAKDSNTAPQDKDANLKPKDSITITFKTMDKGAEDVAQQNKVAHEGSHVLDFQDVMAGGKPMTLYQTEMNAFRRSMRVLLDSNDVLDIGGELFIPPTSPFQKNYNQREAEKVLAGQKYGLTEQSQGGLPYIEP